MSFGLCCLSLAINGFGLPLAGLLRTTFHLENRTSIIRKNCKTEALHPPLCQTPVPVTQPTKGSEKKFCIKHKRNLLASSFAVCKAEKKSPKKCSIRCVRKGRKTITRRIVQTHKHVLIAAKNYNLKKYLKFIRKQCNAKAAELNIPLQDLYKQAKTTFYNLIATFLRSKKMEERNLALKISFV